jgi:hypothetical protein
LDLRVRGAGVVDCGLVVESIAEGAADDAGGRQCEATDVASLRRRLVGCVVLRFDGV